MHSITIGRATIGPGHPPFIIAEAGVNHNGSLEAALALVDCAANAGADAVKFQTFKAEQVVTDAGAMAAYQVRNTGKETSQQELLRPLQFAEDWYAPVIEHCTKQEVLFLSTPHGHIESAKLLERLGVAAHKVGSGDLTNKPLLEYLAQTGKPVIISTGMATEEEIKEAVGWFDGWHARARLIVLHCTTDYPTQPTDANLSGITTLKHLFPSVLIGFSDHTEGYHADIIAAALGACVIEKHITLDKNAPGPDQKASLDPDELKEMVRAVKQVPTYLGNGDIKEPREVERPYIKMARKSVVAARHIANGSIITADDLTIKRPEGGIAPKELDSLIGKTAREDISADTTITAGMIS